MLIYAGCEKLDQSELDAYPNISSKMAEMVIRKDEDAGDAAAKQKGSLDEVEHSVKDTSTTSSTNEKKAKTSKLCNVI